MDTDLDTLLRSIIDRIKGGKVTLPLIMDILHLVIYLGNLAIDGPKVFGAAETGETAELSNELYFELTGETPPMQGAVSAVGFAILRKVLIEKAIKLVDESELSLPIKKFLNWIFEFQQRHEPSEM